MRRNYKKIFGLRQDVFKDIFLHVVITFIIASFFYIIYREISYIFLCFLGGILIDLDHVIDYIIYYGFRFRPLYFFTHRFIKSGKVFIFFHSWEIVFVLALFSITFPILLAVWISAFAHLSIDTLLGHRNRPLFYFLIFRMIKRFDYAKIDRDSYNKLINALGDSDNSENLG